MAILLYSRRREWPLEAVTVECSHERVHCRDLEDCEEDDRAYVNLIRRNISLKGDLSDDQIDRIGRIARRCPVHRTLESGPMIEDEIDRAPPD